MVRAPRRIAHVGVALALTVSLGGCFAPGPASTPEPTETETAVVEAALGVPIRVEQEKGVAELTIVDATWSTDAPGSLPFAPEGDHGYLIMNATWTTLEGETTIVANYWMVRDPSGTDGVHFLFVDEAFSEIDLPAGQTISGQIGFEISPGPYTFIIFDDRFEEAGTFTFDAAPRESDGVG